MQNILITGADGQLGSVLKSLAANYPEFKFYYTDIAELNITNQAAIDDFVSGHNITRILNTAGYTNADKAESDSEQAFLINGTAVGFLAESAKKNNALLIHISTDYVFGNNHFRPIVESASPYHSRYMRHQKLMVKKRLSNTTLTPLYYAPRGFTQNLAIISLKR